MAETMSFALVGALILTLTLVPVLASYWFKGGVREKPNRAYEWMKRKYAVQLDWALDRPQADPGDCRPDLWGDAAAGPVHRRRIHAASR